MFVGPKDVDLMGTISPRLGTLIDWGTLFGWAARPLFAVLHFFNDGYIHNWGWSIVVVTILINLITLPFKYTGLKSARKMQIVQPELKLLQDKYKGMAMSDPRRGKQQEEMMALYAKHGVNPVSGCIPNLLILPVAIAFYNALSAAIELRGAGWLWVTDLSRPETIAIHMLPVLMLITQLLTMKMMPQPGSDPTQQKMMMLMMPMMLVFFMYNQSSGLVLYWLTSNIVGIAQQMIFNRFSPAIALPAPATKSLAKKK
jgi:YidC/Oxa1 family membrane protein insertase